ncbi:MAG: lipoyl synthase [Deltaproteobacteria bacterium]|nr:lipoyl synthase [Deltaproteobacteria bacterium]
MSQQEPKPTWLRIKVPSSPSNKVISVINNKSLHTVCAEAKCPNQMQCFARGQATFLLLGPSCTRRCTFCAVDKSSVQKPDIKEPARIAHAIDHMGLSYSVLTMVTRDDLTDGGASHIIKTMREIRKLSPDTDIELLISDLNGNWDALDMILQTKPAVINHNIETVPRLYPSVRPQADYKRSMRLLTRVSSIQTAIITKSGMMLGLGEEKHEILSTMDDLRNAGCQLLTLGQYLSPSHGHHPVIRYIPPNEFDEYKKEALDRGFLGVASAPLVRSSYRAADLFCSVRNGDRS